jgi:hypothetical protein
MDALEKRKISGIAGRKKLDDEEIQNSLYFKGIQ